MKNLKSIRTKLNLSQKEFAAMIGATQSAISQYENNIRTPPKKFFKKISETFSIDLDKFQPPENANLNNTVSDKKEADIERIIKILTDTSLSVDPSTYLNEMMKEVFINSKMLLSHIQTMETDKKRSLVLSDSSLWSYEIDGGLLENILNQSNSKESLMNYVFSLENEELDRILTSNPFESAIALIQKGTQDIQSIIKSIKDEFYNRIDNDENLRILLQHNLIRPSSLIECWDWVIYCSVCSETTSPMVPQRLLKEEF